MKIDEVLKIGKIKPGGFRKISPKRVNDVIGFIQNNCTDILSTYKQTNKLLYRGTKEFNFLRSPEFFLKKSYDKRIPKDTIKKYQDQLDRKLKEAGFEALRSNSIFTTGQESTADSYGDKYAIFPIDGFSYTWAEGVEDLTTKYGLTDEHEHGDFKHDLEFSKAKDFIKDYHFRNDDLKQAIKNKVEVYIHGTFVAVKAEHGLFEIIMYALFENKIAELFIKERLKVDGTLLQYIKNPTKTMIFTALKKSGNAIKFVNNPTYAMQLAAVNSFGCSIQYIENPSEELKLAAVSENPYALKYIKDPSYQLQKMAIENDGTIIYYIERPTEELLVMAVSDYPSIFGSIVNKLPKNKMSLKVLLAAVKDVSNLRFIKEIFGSIPLQVQMAAVKHDAFAMQWLRDASKEVQIAAIKQNNTVVRNLSNFPWCTEARDLAYKLSGMKKVNDK